MAEQRLIGGMYKDVKNIRAIDGYEQFNYMSGYNIEFWQCTCGQFNSSPSTPKQCKHVIGIG